MRTALVVIGGGRKRADGRDLFNAIEIQASLDDGHGNARGGPLKGGAIFDKVQEGAGGKGE